MNLMSPGLYSGSAPFTKTVSDHFNTLIFAPGGPGLDVRCSCVNCASF
jgi:hypothetical protein